MKQQINLGLKTALLAGFASLGSVAYGEQELYQETFPWTDTTTQDLELRDQGWCGGNAGDKFCDNAPVTDANQGGEGAISSGNGPDETPGFAFWSQTGINADSFLYTDEFPFDSSQLISVTWKQRNSGDDPARLAFRIGSDWYISDQTFVDDTNTWVTTTVDLSSLTFFLRSDDDNDPTTLPGGGVPASPGGLSLPAGTVNAFGFWWDGPKTATSRVDDVTLVGIADLCTTVDLIGVRASAAVGEIEVCEDPDNDKLTVTVLADAPYCITLANVAIGETIDDIPQFQGTPLPNLFPLVEQPGCDSEVIFSGVSYDSSTETVVTARVLVFNLNTFTGDLSWPDGIPFPEARTRATYFLLGSGNAAPGDFGDAGGVE